MPTAAIDSGQTSTPDPNSLVFDFQSPVFNIAGAVFRRDPVGDGIVCCIPLGNLKAAIPVDTLRQEFNIDENSPDMALLDHVARALKYVKEVRSGDSIPWEVMDGRAPWMTDEKYLAAAKRRLATQLIDWLKANGSADVDANWQNLGPDGSELSRIVEAAFIDIARAVGYGDDRRQEVVDLVERLAGELSYIEALRDRFSRLRRVVTMLKSLYQAYKTDRSLQEVIARCSALIAKPSDRVFSSFDVIDANTGELLQMLKRFDGQVDYIRRARSELCQMHLLWDEMLEQWENVQVARNAAAERAVRETYRFLARHFPTGVTWTGTA